MSGMHIITVAEEADAPVHPPDSKEDIERLLLTSANAIQRLVSERNALRSRVEILERELTGLRQQTTLVHDSYRTLTTEFVTQFQLIDKAVKSLFREPSDSAEASPAEEGALALRHHAA